MAKSTGRKATKSLFLLNNNTYVDLKLNDKDAGKAKGRFSGIIFGDDAALAEDLHAYYPAEISKDASSVTLPASYNLGTDFDNTHSLMRAEDQNGELIFKHLGGILKFNLENVPAGAAQVIFTTLDGKNITGDFTLTPSGENMSVNATAGNGSHSSITMNFEPLTEATDLYISFPVPAGSYEGIKLEIKNADNNDVVEPVAVPEANNTVSRASCVVMPAVTFVEIEAGEAVPDGMVECNGVTYESIAAAIAANSAETTLDITLGKGSFELPARNDGKDITFTGVDKEESIIDFSLGSHGNGKYQYMCLNGADYTFRNLKIKSVFGSYLYPGVHGTATAATYDNCVLEGLIYLYNNNEIFTNCIFNLHEDGYQLWSWGAKNITLTGCTFNNNTKGKNFLIYGDSSDSNQSYGGFEQTINISNCEFNTGAASGDKCAVEIHSEHNYHGSVSISGCTVNGSGWNSVNGGLWREVDNSKKPNVEPTTNFTIIINGTTVQTSTWGLPSVEQLTPAQFAAKYSVSFGCGTASQSIYIDGQNNVEVTEWLDGWYGGDITIKNVTFLQGLTLSSDATCPDGSTVTIEGCTIHACNQSLLTSEKYDRIDNSGAGLCFDVETSNQIGNNRVGHNITVIVKNCTFIGENDPTLPRDGMKNWKESGKARGHAVCIDGISGNCLAQSVLIEGCTMAGVRGNAIQLYTFNCPITIKDCTIESWGMNAQTTAGTKTDCAIRGDFKQETDNPGTLTISNVTFGLDQSSNKKHINIDRSAGGPSTTANLTAGTYSYTLTYQQ